MNGDPPLSAAEASTVADAAATPPLTSAEAVEGWNQLCRLMGVLLRQPEPDAAWRMQLNTVMLACRALARRDVDAALYLLLQLGAAEGGRYSTCHAMLCALICELCSNALGWTAEETTSLVHASFTMNLSMTELQDALVNQQSPLTAVQREQVDSHAQHSATLLEAAGVDDALWLEVVRLHHAQDTDTVEEGASAGTRLAALLHRVDVYTAKLSGRVGREPKSPAIAARDTCLGVDGKPDRVGGVLLRTLGLYPPGCFVQLANGDFGVVVERGIKAHTPCVAALRREDGGMYNLPRLRRASESAHAVRHGVTGSAVNVRCDHLRILNAA